MKNKGGVSKKTTKICSSCKVEKSVKNFYSSGVRKGHFSTCKECINIHRSKNKTWQTWWGKYKKRSPCRRWAYKSIYGHIKRGFSFQSSLEELEEVALATKKCCYCGIELNWSYESKRNGPSWKSPSLDRLDNSKILTMQNIQIICHMCNTTKHKRTHDEFIDYCHKIVEKFGGNPFVALARAGK